MKGLLLTLVAALLLVATPTTAGPEKVAFPSGYQSHVLYTTVDRPDIKEVRDIYAAPDAVKVARAGQSLPNGTVLTMVHYNAKVNDKGELVKDANGRLVKGDVNRIGVMEKRTGWGVEYPEDIRNGEWEYALFKSDHTVDEKANVKACFQCHKPQSEQDFLFTLSKLVRAPK